jgi:hypothetical protein
MSLENTQETDLLGFSTLGCALAELATRMEPQAAAEIAKGLAATLRNSQGTDSALLSFFRALVKPWLRFARSCLPLVKRTYWRFPVCYPSERLERRLKTKINFSIGSC